LLQDHGNIISVIHPNTRSAVPKIYCPSPYDSLQAQDKAQGKIGVVNYFNAINYLVVFLFARHGSWAVPTCT
jgi:hypothetical protein